MRGKRSEQTVVQIVRKKELPLKPKRLNAKQRAEVEAIAATQAEAKAKGAAEVASDQAWQEAEAKPDGDAAGGLGDGAPLEVKVEAVVDAVVEAMVAGTPLEVKTSEAALEKLEAPGRPLTGAEYSRFLEGSPLPDGAAAEPWAEEIVASETLKAPDRRGVNASVDGPSIANPATLAGDMRDIVLDLIQRQEKVWAKMLNYEQAVLADKLIEVCRDVVDKAVAIALDTPMPYITVTLDRVALDKDIKLTISSAYNGSSLAKVGDAIHKQATLVLVSPDQFKGQRNGPKLDPDQAALSLGEVDDQEA
jgi:hypothetical protein